MILIQHRRALRRDPLLNQGLFYDSDIPSYAMHDSFVCSLLPLLYALYRAIIHTICVRLFTFIFIRAFHSCIFIHHTTPLLELGWF